MTAASHDRHAVRPLFGLRRRPGRLALAVMRLPRALYHHGLGKLLGHTFLLVTHEGRKTGRPHETVAMALTLDPETKEVVICAAWGPNTAWLRNLHAHPALRIQIGEESYVPTQRFLTDEESMAVAAEFRRRHPMRLRLFAAILGWGELGADEEVRAFVRDRPFVAFRPRPAP